MGIKKRPSGPTDGSFIAQIIYPQNIQHFDNHAYLVGWNLENFRCTIACLTNITDEQVRELTTSLSASSNDLQSMMIPHGQSRPVILGEIFRNVDDGYIPSADKQAHSMWITLTLNREGGNIPKLLSLYSLGCKYETSSYLFGYDPANVSALECYHVDRRSLVHGSNDDNQLSGLSSDLWSQSDLHLIVCHINTAQELHGRVQHYLNQNSRSSENKPEQSDERESSVIFKLKKVMCTMVSSLCIMLSNVVFPWCFLLRQVIRSLNHKYVLFTLGTGFSQFLGLSGSGGIESTSYGAAHSPGPHSLPPKSGTITNSGVTLRDLSLTGAYIAERALRTLSMVQKCGYFPHAWLLPPALKQHIWIEIHGFLFLLWLDMLLGVLFGYFVYSNAERIVQYLHRECDHLQTRVIFDTLEWFNHSPGGVKLNTVITQKFGALLVTLLKYFDIMVLATQSLHVSVVHLIACFGTFGFTVQLVLIVDIARMLTLHIALIHRALSYLHEFLLQCLNTLWLLFQGQKKNILRKRIDTCRFGQDQLLFGIVLFTILLFVFPSFAAYFFLFALAQLSCVAFQFVVYSLSVVVKEFPYYEAFLYALRPAMQSDGVQFQVLPSASTSTSSSSSAGISSPLSPTSIAAAAAATTKSKSFVKTTIPPPLPPPLHAQAVIGSSPSGISKQQKHAGDNPVVVSQPREPHKSSRDLSSLNPTTTLKSGELRGILKTTSDTALNSSNSQNSPSIAGCAPSVVDAPASVSALHVSKGKGRVSFQNSTVRTFPLYRSDDSADSDGEADVSEPLLYRSSYVHPSLTDSEDRLSGKQQWNQLMSFQQPTHLPSGSFSGATHSGGARSKSGSNSNSSGGVAFIKLTGRAQSKARLFASYLRHMTYLSQERGAVAVRLLRGVVYGRPALDIQLIHGTSDISDQRERSELAVMDEIVRILTSSVAAASRTAEATGEKEHDCLVINHLRRLQGRACTYYQQYHACIRAAMEGADTFTPSAVASTGYGEESAPLLSESSTIIKANQAQSEAGQEPLDNSICRSMSRRMLFAVLLTLAAHFMLCLLGLILFFSTLRLSWEYSSRAAGQRGSVVGVVEASALALLNKNITSAVRSQISIRKLVAVTGVVPKFS